MCKAKVYLGQARHLVVDEGCDVELKHLGVLGDDVCSGAIELIALELVVDLDDVSQLVRQVILEEQDKTGCASSLRVESS